MATLDEVVTEILGDDYIHDSIQFVIDSDLRVISIPGKGVVAGVVGDKNVNRINFQISRYYNGFDMSKFTTRVNYVNARGNFNYYSVTDLTIEDDLIYFTWLVDSDVVAYAGIVIFAVNMFITDSNGKITQSFNTSNKGFLNVLEGIQVNEYVTPEEQEDILTRLEADISKYVDSGITKIDENTNKSIQKIQTEKNRITESITSGINSISSSTTESIDEIRNEGINVKKSIPADYTELDKTVSGITDQIPGWNEAKEKVVSLKEDIGEKGTALTDIQKKVSDSNSNDGFLLCDLNGNIVGHIASFEVWNNEPYNKKYGWGGHPYGNGKLPPYSKIAGVLEADLLSVRGGKGRWNKDDTGNFQHGGHLFEGWNAEEDARLTFGIGTKNKDISWIQTFHAATQEGTDSGSYYCVTKVGSDINNQGVNFMPSITQSKSLFSLKVGDNLSPDSKHIQKLVETGELVDWEYNKTDMIPYGTMYFDYTKDKVRVYTRTGGWKYLKFEEEV